MSFVPRTLDDVIEFIAESDVGYEGILMIDILERLRPKEMEGRPKNMRHFYLRSAAGFPVACIASTILKQDGTLSDGPLSEGDRIAFAFSIHNPKDEFDRHMARRVAEGRLLKRHGDIVIDTQKDIKLRIVETLLGSVEHLAKPLPKRVQDAARHWLMRHDAREAAKVQHD